MNDLPMDLPPRIPLARLPTPVEPSPRLGRALGIELLYARDDLSGLELTGNKARKLEFLLAEAEAEGADTLVTCGGVQSNHARATAYAGAKRGLRSVLVLRVPDPTRPPAPCRSESKREPTCNSPPRGRSMPLPAWTITAMDLTMTDR